MVLQALDDGLRSTQSSSCVGAIAGAVPIRAPVLATRWVLGKHRVSMAPARQRLVVVLAALSAISRSEYDQVRSEYDQFHRG